MQDQSTCLGIKRVSKVVTGIKFSEVFAAESVNYGTVHGSSRPSAGQIGQILSGHSSEVCSISVVCYAFTPFHMVIICVGTLVTLMQMYRFTVHGFERSKASPSVWVLAAYTFGHKDQRTCDTWVNRINDYLNLEEGRPKNLMVCLANPKWLILRLVKHVL